MTRTSGRRCSLMLNADFTPIAIISWKRAMVLSVLNQENRHKGLEIVDFYEHETILTCGGERMPLPAVVRSPVYIKQHRRKIAFSRKHVFLRDNYSCQYCGKFCPDGVNLTYDHLVSRSEWKLKSITGTPTNFKNVVSACIQCNRKKGDKPLAQSGLSLRAAPDEIHPRHVILGLNPFTRHIPQEWLMYLPENYVKLREKKAKISSGYVDSV